MHLRNWWSQKRQMWCTGWMCKSQPTDDKPSMIGGVVRSCDPLKFFGAIITGTAEPKVVKLCTHIGYINCSNKMTYHPQRGRGYGHLTVKKFCCLLWCSASRGFVSYSWATCRCYPHGDSYAWIFVSMCLSDCVSVCLCVCVSDSNWPIPAENGDFNRFRLIVPQPWELSKKFNYH